MNHDVLIVGGGVVGLSAALAMHQRGFSVALLDAGVLQVNATDISPRVYAINQASQRLLQQLNVWERLDTHRVSAYQHMHVWDAVNQAHIDFDSRLIAADRLGSMIDEANLRHGLLQEIAQCEIPLFANSRITAVQIMPESIEISNAQQTWSTKLLIVADGALSPIRELLQVSITTWPYDQHALVATVQTEQPHQKTAYQIFTPQGPLAFLPLTDPHQCSIVWSSAPHLTQERMALSDLEFNQQLTAAFEAHLGQVALTTQRVQFPLHMRHVKQYTGPRWLLMGDAAHTIHPLAGLGLNVGLADLAAWLALIDENKRRFYSKKILGAYQRERKFAVWQTIALMEGLKALFLNSTPPVAALRGLGLKVCNQLTLLKRLFVERASE